MGSPFPMKYIYWVITAIIFSLTLVSVYIFSPPVRRFELHPLKEKTNNEAAEKCACENKIKEREDSWANATTTESTWLRQNFAKELHEIHLQLKKLLFYKRMPSPELVEKVGELAKRLDGKAEPANPNSGIKNTSLDVCPEEFKGGTFGYPYFSKGWVLADCTEAKPLSSVISVAINTVTYPQEDEKHIDNVFKGINDTYPSVHVYVATQSDDIVETAKRFKNIDAVKVNDTKVAKVWNTLKTKASTPYMLIARDVVHFSWLTQVERQIRVISQIPNVKVAGGAYRNISGQWKVGCEQTKLLNYVLEYQEGYYHSQNSCMFCDYLQGPFVTKTELFQLDESLPNEVVFEDWFLRIGKDGNQAMACPDAMYFTSDHTSLSKNTKKDVWTPLAKKWTLNRILLPQGVKYSFSCKDIEVTCQATSELLPICCLEEYAKVMALLQKLSNERKILFELDHGSLLGGVKFNGLLPYDIDGDITLVTKQIDIFSKDEIKELFRSNGFSIYGYQSPHLDKGKLIHGFTYIGFNGFKIEVWGMQNLTNFLHAPLELRNLASFTKANLRGNWVNTACSPGLFARNRYGREILKHSQSWRKQGLKDSWQGYHAGSFKPCRKPKHHSCVENMPADGNIPFLVD